MFDLIIFDCDGVLFDSSRANVEYYNAVLARLGAPRLTQEWERRVHYLASGQVYDELFGTDSEMAREARRAAREVDYTPFFDYMLPVPDLHATLGALRRAHRLAMATNRGSTVGEIMSRFGLDRHIELAVGVKDVPRPKPHPDLLLKCLDHFGVDGERAVYVGDAVTDRAAAEAAGVHFVAVGEEPWAAERIPELRALPGWIARRTDGRRATGDPDPTVPTTAGTDAGGTT